MPVSTPVVALTHARGAALAMAESRKRENVATRKAFIGMGRSSIMTRARMSRRDNIPTNASTELDAIPSAPPSYNPPMQVLGIETSCDETGPALSDTHRGVFSHALR